MIIEAHLLKKLKSKERIAFHCICMAVDGMVSEFKFHPTRLWRFDYYHPSTKSAYEYEGIAGKGKMRHTTVVGFTNDAEKYNEAARLGIKVFRFTALNYNDVKYYLPIIK